MMEKMKRSRGKTALEKMLNAEFLFSKDPDNLSYVQSMLNAAVEGGYKETAKWAADMVFQANNSADKPSFAIYQLLKDSYSAIGEAERAVAACKSALNIKPNDGELAEEFKNLSARLTLSRGRYEEEGDFRKSLKDKEGQERLAASHGAVKSEDYRQTSLEAAKKDFAADPDLEKNIVNLAEAFCGLNTDKGALEAISVLENAYHRTKNFSFRQRAAKIRILQIKAKVRDAKTRFAKNPGDSAAKEAAAKLTEQLNNVELEFYQQCVQNYPTNLSFKYDLGVRLVRKGSFDEAIPYFQDAQKELKHKISAKNQIGYCFFKKGWYTDAIDIYKDAIGSHEFEDDSVAKELRYNLARAYEAENDIEKAMELYRKLAQLDFSYKDVRLRLDKLRKKE